MKDEEWDDIMETDLKSVFRLSRSVLRAMMKARYGRIINISSVVGSTGSLGQANYAAAKAGIFGFSKSLAREVGSRHITVNCIAPGFIETDMTRSLTTQQQQSLIQHVPLGRLGRPEEGRFGRGIYCLPGSGLYHRGDHSRKWRHAYGLTSNSWRNLSTASRSGFEIWFPPYQLSKIRGSSQRFHVSRWRVFRFYYMGKLVRMAAFFLPEKR